MLLIEPRHCVAAQLNTLGQIINQSWYIYNMAELGVKNRVLIVGKNQQEKFTEGNKSGGFKYKNV